MAKVPKTQPVQAPPLAPPPPEGPWGPVKVTKPGGAK